MEKCQFLESFIYCPKCGGDFRDNNFKSKRCEKCGFIFYFNPSSAVAAIIKNSKGEILVSTRDREPEKGSYDLPGGFVDSFETGEQSVKREVKEECNIDLSAVKYLFSIPNVYSYSDFDVHTLDMFYECEVEDFRGIRADDDVAELQFIAIEDLDLTRFGFASIREGLRLYIASLTPLKE